MESKARLVSYVKNSDKWVAPKLTATTVNKNSLTVTGIGTFILDFQTTNFDDDSKIIMKMLCDYRASVHGETHNPQNQEYYTLDPPVSSAGWSFAKLFVAGQFVEKLYQRYTDQIEESRGKKFEDKFVSWFARELELRNCQAKIKIAQEMRI